MKNKFILLIVFMLAVSMSLTSCSVIAVTVSTLFLDVDENGELLFAAIDTGYKEAEVQEWLGMTEMMLVFTTLEDGTCCVSIGRATEYVNIEIPDKHEDKTVTHIKCFRDGDFTSIVIPVGVTHIEDGAFSDAEQLTDVYYAGTEKQWAQITIGENNDYLKNATMHFNHNS